MVSPSVKFPVRRRTGKAGFAETQTHGYEVDLLAARADSLVLATVKSYLGSRGVVAEHVTGKTTNALAAKRYMLLNDPVIRRTVVQGAASRLGYPVSQVRLRLYVGRFAAPRRGVHEAAIRNWCARQRAGAGPIEVFGLDQILDSVRRAAARTPYRDNPVLVTMKVLAAAGLLDLDLPAVSSA